MTSSLVKSITSYASLTQQEVNIFLDLLVRKSFAKGELLLDIGEVCKAFSFIIKGSFKQYFKNEELDEEITNLFIENDWVLNHQSFTAQKPSLYKIEAFEDSEILSINIHQLHELIRLHPSFFALGKILESIDSGLKSKKTPEEKYVSLLDSRPEFIQKFPLKYIASYLGMTPETLSRVRSRIR